MGRKLGNMIIWMQYTEVVEMLTLYLATLVEGDVEDAEDADEDEDNEDENDDAVCERCGAIIPEDEEDGDYLVVSNEYVCYKCMSAEEYRKMYAEAYHNS